MKYPDKSLDISHKGSFALQLFHLLHIFSFKYTKTDPNRFFLKGIKQAHVRLKLGAQGAFAPHHIPPRVAGH